MKIATEDGYTHSDIEPKGSNKTALSEMSCERLKIKQHTPLRKTKAPIRTRTIDAMKTMDAIIRTGLNI